MYQLARVGCLAFGAFILFVILMSLIVPLLMLAALAGVVYLFVLLWRSSLSLRTKRAITGMLVYPAGLYFLWRYTRYDQNVKLGALAVTVGATALLSAAPAALFGLVPLMGAGFLFLFLTGSEATTPLPAPAMPVAEVPAGRTGKVEIPRPDRRRLLEIESANTATERRVLQVREFSRLASAALAALPDDPKSWPSKAELASLREQARVLRSSVADPIGRALPDPSPSEPVPAELLTRAIDALASYTALLATTPASGTTDLERLRVLARERARLAAIHDEIADALGDRLPKV